MPFHVAWTDAPPAQRARTVVQRHLFLLGAWNTGSWVLQLCASVGGTVIGVQELMARDFGLTGEVSTASWLGAEHQGKGYGTEMRAAVLELAFAGLGAEYATSAAFEDNYASLSVSRRLGYQSDGIDQFVVRGKARIARRWRMNRELWNQERSTTVTVHGLPACREFFTDRPAAASSPGPPTPVPVK
ncbi:GNAT family N-acetyltransferase [Streptomyces sp. R08]|uniref:GNAT family N-acetyltransferase n=1 Tax=Streptomyces sp. R08 TaxID=3238624 RepID=A0AB39MR26_9ACTN